MDRTIFSRFRGFRVFVGFSGGADSTAVLLLALDAGKRYGFHVAAVHFNHHLRGAESDGEAAAAESFARAHGAQFIRFDLTLPPGGNLEARARAARLEKFRELAGGDPRAAVMLGHHADDRLETMFLRLLRGSNASGVAGMRMDTVIDGVRIFRPLFHRSRAEVERFLRENGVSGWATDSSNGDCGFDRNFLRNRLLPELFSRFPRSRRSLIASLDNLECDAEFIEEESRRMYDPRRCGDPAYWLAMHPAVRCRVLRRFLDARFGVMPPPSRESVRRFDAALASGRAGVIELDRRRRLRLSGGRIVPDAPVPPPVRWRWREEELLCWGNWRFRAEHPACLPADLPLTAACFDADTLPEELEISAPLRGERMLPFGGDAPVSLRELRIKRRVPAFPPPPVLRIPGGKALWAAGVRHSGEFTVRPGGKVVMISGEIHEDFE